MLARLLVAPSAPVLLTGDSETYLAPALDLARGNGFELSLKRTPGYPLLIAASLAWLGEDLARLTSVQHALGLATALLTCLLGAALAGWRPGALAGLATALAGNLLLYERLVMTETLFTTLLVATVLLAVLLARSGAVGWAVVFGLAVASASLGRPVAQPLLALAPLGLLLARQSWRRVALLTLCALAGYGLVVLPWGLARASSGEPGEMGALGQTLVGRIARHDRGGFTVYDPALHATEPDEARLRARRIVQEAVDRGSSGRAVHTRLKKELGLSDAAADRLMRDLALEAIRRDAGYYLSGTLQRFVRLWSTSPERPRDHLSTQRTVRERYEDAESLPLVQRTAIPEGADLGLTERVVGLFQPGTWGPALGLLFLLGVAAAVARDRLVLLPALATLGLLLLSAALVGGVARYRYTEDPLIFAVGATGLLWLADQLRLRLRRDAPS